MGRAGVQGRGLTEHVIRESESIVDESGPGMLAREPFEVFMRLRARGGGSRALGGAAVCPCHGHGRLRGEVPGTLWLEGALRVVCHLDAGMENEQFASLLVTRFWRFGTGLPLSGTVGPQGVCRVHGPTGTAAMPRW